MWLSFAAAGMVIIVGGMMLTMGLVISAPSSAISLPVSTVAVRLGSSSAAPLVTPVLDGSVGLMQTSELPVSDSEFEVQISTATSEIANARVVNVIGDYSVVALDQPQPALSVAAEQDPGEPDATIGTLAAIQNPPDGGVPISELATVEITILPSPDNVDAGEDPIAAVGIVCGEQDGAPVVDDLGQLVGLCSDDGQSVIPVSGFLASDVVDGSLPDSDAPLITAFSNG